MTNQQADAALLLSEAINFMAKKANVTAQEIVAAIDADRNGNAMRYLCDLLDIGVAALERTAA